MSTPAEPPCPNPECRGSEIGPAYRDAHPVTWVYITCFGCGTSGPRVELQRDVTIDSAATAEARRLWALLPREPRWTSEPPKVPGRVAVEAYPGAEPYIVDVSQAMADNEWRGGWKARYFPLPDPPIPTPAGRGERSDDL